MLRVNCFLFISTERCYSSASRAPGATMAICPARRRKCAGRLARAKDHRAIEWRRLVRSFGARPGNGESRRRRDHEVRQRRRVNGCHRRGGCGSSHTPAQQHTRTCTARCAWAPRRGSDFIDGPRWSILSFEDGPVSVPNSVLEGRAHLAHAFGLPRGRLCQAAFSVAARRCFAARRREMPTAAIASFFDMPRSSGCRQAFFFQPFGIGVFLFVCLLFVVWFVCCVK